VLKHENANVADKHESFFNNLLPSVLLKACFSYEQVFQQHIEQIILAHAMKNSNIILLSRWILLCKSLTWTITKKPHVT